MNDKIDLLNAINSQQSQIESLKLEVASEVRQKYAAYKRIGELTARLAAADAVGDMTTQLHNPMEFIRTK